MGNTYVVNICMNNICFTCLNKYKMTDWQTLEEQKMCLVWQYNSIQEKIDDYWLLDISYYSWPLKELIVKRENIKRDIDVINKLLYGD